MANDTLDLTSLGPLLEDEVNTIIQRFGLGVMVRNIKSSPVDTGRFRSNWTIDFDSGSGNIPNINATGSRESASSESISRVTSQISSFDISKNKSMSLLNNLPYAEKLASGHSTQAPAGWLDLNIRNELKSFESVL